MADIFLTIGTTKKAHHVFVADIEEKSSCYSFQLDLNQGLHEVENDELIGKHSEDVAVGVTLAEEAKIDERGEAFVYLQIAEELPRGRTIMLNPGTSDMEIGRIIMVAKQLGVIGKPRINIEQTGECCS